MSENIFVSLRPTAGAQRALYTVPAAKRFTGRIIVANCGELTLVVVALSKAGLAFQSQDAIMYETPVDRNVSIATAPIMISATDVIRVLSLSGDVNFHVTGLLQDL